MSSLRKQWPGTNALWRDGRATRIVSHGEDDEIYELSTLPSTSQGTRADQYDMHVLGREQQLNRNFHFISVLGFASTFMSTWEVVLTTIEFGLMNGGTAGLIWGYLIVLVGYMFVFATVAEMASMAPTPGGQYHWVSEFAPRQYQKFLSYITGWMCVLGWQTALTTITFIVGTLIQDLLVLNYPNYVSENWHGTLLAISVTLFAIIFNTIGAKRLPLVEGSLLMLHVFGFFTILIPLWVLSPRNNVSAVFTTFSNQGGWSNYGTSMLVGMLTPVFALLGSDSTVHMSEEIKDASVVIPLAMMWAIAINGVLGFAMLLTFCFTLGDIDSVLATNLGFPFIQVFYNTTESYTGATVMVVIVLVTITSSAISTIGTASRQLWSFARDNGLPFSPFFARVKPGWNIPLNAVLVSLGVNVVLSMINIGSKVALNAITSLMVCSLLSSYIVSTMCLLRKRILKEPLPVSRWTLGRFGIYINAVALMFLLVIWVFTFFPTTATVNSTTMNWNVLMYCGVIIFAAVHYRVWGRHVYVGPVALIKRDLRYPDQARLR